MKATALLLSTVLLAGVGVAQQPMRTPGPGGPPEAHREGMPRMKMRQPGLPEGEMRMRRGMPGGGKWWKNSDVVKAVGLSDDQVQRMEKIFQDYRLKLVDQHATLQKEELSMEPLIESDTPDEAKITAQIDRIAAARAALEKSNALMMLGIRKVMTAEQWKKLQEVTPPPPPPPMGPPAPGDGPMKRRAGDLDE